MGACRPSVIEALELGLMIRIRNSDMAWVSFGDDVWDEVLVLRVGSRRFSFIILHYSPCINRQRQSLGWSTLAMQHEHSFWSAIGNLFI